MKAGNPLCGLATSYEQTMSRFIAAIPMVFLLSGSIFLGAQHSAPGAATVPENLLPGWHWDFSGTVNISSLDSLRKNALASGDNNADETLYRVFCQQADTLRFDLSNEDFIRKYITDAEILTHARYYLPENSLLFEAMGDYMLSNLTDTLKHAINANLVEQQDPSVTYIVQRLADNHMLIDIKVSNWKKIFTYLLEGRFGYVFHKLTTTYKPEFLKFLGVLCAIAMLFFLRKKIVTFIKNRLNRTRLT